MIRLFLGRLFADRTVWALPVAGFALTSGIGLMVFGGAMYFYTLPDTEDRMLYSVYATAALILLVIPMLALMGSAARLLAHRRDERLAGLRLLGASSGQLRRLVLAESAALAVAGILTGAFLYVALMPLVGRLPFAGAPMGVSGLWLGVGLLAAACGVLLVFAMAAAFVGLRRVEVTPLGVRTRQAPQRVKWMRAVIAVAAVVVVFVLHTMVPIRGELVIMVVAFAFLAVPLLAVQLIGPWVLKLITARQTRRAGTAERLIAARNVLDSPQRMWRQVGGVAVAAFIGVIAGCGVGLISLAEFEQGSEEAMIFADVARGVWLTLFIAFLLTACSVGLNQTAQILDQRDLYSGLAKTGVTLTQLNRIRSLAVMRALAAVLVVAVLAACIVAMPIVGWAILTTPVSVLTIAAVLMAGVLLIYFGTLVTRLTMRAVVEAG
ncbi:permease [Nesterenkonia muleiensis]|uniref:permease n=1 Tax=Nesterenkonia muleiensis TaxID=2282648 RepID=UPI000E73B079|nr:permease [Nesterenkonia muleiensis]